MQSLAEFQASFTHQLRSAELTAMSSNNTAAMTVYCNTVMKGFIEALAANYPTVLKLVGEEWFEAAAIRFIHDAPADTPVLAEYGKGFVEFLEHFEPASDMPYLSSVASIDWQWIESYFAADASGLQPTTLQLLDTEQLLDTRLSLHPATRLCAVNHSAVTIWLHNHADDTASELHVKDTDEFALITRNIDVVLQPLSVIEYEFVKDIDHGATLGEAAMMALADDENFPLSATLAKLINARCFSDNQFRSW